MDKRGDKSKKRKMGHEEEEEEAMEKFFALIRSTREVRERLLQGSKELKGEMNKKVEEEKLQVATWYPSFQPEDFMEDAKLKSSVVESQAAGPSSTSKKGKEDMKQGGGGGALPGERERQSTLCVLCAWRRGFLPEKTSRVVPVAGKGVVLSST
ncbi:hypothetical protein CFOL_v3_16865, partial [Cephalotus follicularis]